ncbi:MAG: histidine kinase [Acidimicrobiales bacterium]
MPAAANGSAVLHHGSNGAALRRTDVELDRDRIERDLHDIVVQRLFATGLTLHNALQFVGANSEVTYRIDQAIEELDRVVRELRITVFELNAAPGREGGLVADGSTPTGERLAAHVRT